MAASMEDIAHFVVAPFHDIVEKGRTAVENAGDNQAMLKAGQSLAKEGERALKRIEPQCKRQVDEFGTNFRDALRDNDEITEFRSQLNDLLWEFDDYIEDAESFDPEKYTELQALSRKAAPKIYDILVRMKLEVPYDDLSPVGSLPYSMTGPASPPFRRSIVASPNHVSVSSSSTARDSGADICSVEDATHQLQKLMSNEDASSVRSEHSPAPRPPQPPTANPWDIKVMPVVDETKSMDSGSTERRPPVARGGSESPIDPSISPFGTVRDSGFADGLGAGNSSPRTSTHHVNIETQGTNGMDHAIHDNDDRSHLPSSYGQSPSRGGQYHFFPGQSGRPRNPTATSNISTTIPEDAALDGTGGLSIGGSMPSATSMPSSSSRHFSPHHSVDSTFAGFEGRRPTIISHHTQYSTADTVASSQYSPTARPLAPDSEGLELAPSNFNLDQELPIPVDVEEAHDAGRSMSQPSSIDCSITPGSSFWLAKGFCEGAKEVSKGGIGVKKTKKPVGFTTSATVARCTSCMCELNFRDIENDVNKTDAGNFSRGSVSYRIRFLQKSHIAAKRVDDVQYGCVFCVQQGHTLDESDATVFTSPKSLMDHISRHARPLPDVPGINVVDGAEVPHQLHNDFDLHFKKSTEPHPVIEARSEIAHLPTGTAKEQARRLYGQRLLFDRTPALELAMAARITGLSWPAKYNGEWAMGWHDGVYASVPTDLVKLDTPPTPHVKIRGTSMIRARARWRFNPGKDKSSDWLKFDKNDIITNIGWSYFDHWCWSGTNAKGKWGIFPQAFIDTNTLEEPTGLNRAISLKDEKNRSTSIMSKFGRKQSHTARPPSVAGSTSSRESKMYIPGRSMADIHATM